MQRDRGRPSCVLLLALLANGAASADTLFISRGGEIARIDPPSGAETPIVSGVAAGGDGACDGLGRVYFATTGLGQVIRWNADGSGETVVVSGVDCTEGPSFDCDGNLYFNQCGAGRPVSGWRLAGADPARAPERIVADYATGGAGSEVVRGGPHRGALLLVSTVDRSVFISEPPGAPPTVFIPPASSSAGSPFGVVTNEAGEVFVTHRGSPGGVSRFDPDGVFLEEYASRLGEPLDLDFDSAGNLYVADFETGVWRVEPNRNKRVIGSVPQARGVAVCRDPEPACPTSCCLAGSCVDLLPADCASQGGVVGHCRAGAACGAPTCDGSLLRPVRGVVGVKLAGTTGLLLAWEPDPPADRYDVYYVTDRRRVPATAEDRPVPGSAPTTVPEALHRNGVPGVGGSVLYYEVVSRCGPPEPAGACCLPGGGCAEVGDPMCRSQGGTWHGATVPCSPDPCGPRGACCHLVNGCSSEVTRAQCEADGGAYQGDATTCVPDPCPPVGACCLFTGCADLMNRADCTSQGGFYQGDGTFCDMVICEGPTGACCIPPDMCFDVQLGTCNGFGGVWLGAGTACFLSPCNPSGACCTPGGSCLDGVDRNTCQGGGGGWFPDTCQTAPCGNCCLNGLCEFFDEPFCTDLGGSGVRRACLRRLAHPAGRGRAGGEGRPVDR
jgi:sugar lactone lactonase YvrE